MTQEIYCDARQRPLHLPVLPTVVLAGLLALHGLGLLAALAFGVRTAARRTRPLFIMRRVRGQAALLGRPAGPPCLHRLSVLRC